MYHRKKTVKYKQKSEWYHPEKDTPWVTHVARKSEGHHRDGAAPPNGRDGLASRCGPAVQLVRRLKGRNRTEARNFSDDPKGTPAVHS